MLDKPYQGYKLTFTCLQGAYILFRVVTRTNNNSRQIFKPNSLSQVLLTKEFFSIFTMWSLWLFHLEFLLLGLKLNLISPDGIVSFLWFLSIVCQEPMGRVVSYRNTQEMPHNTKQCFSIVPKQQAAVIPQPFSCHLRSCL